MNAQLKDLHHVRFRGEYVWLRSVLQKFPEEAKVFDRFSREATFFAVPGVPFCRVQDCPESADPSSMWVWLSEIG